MSNTDERRVERDERTAEDTHPAAGSHGVPGLASMLWPDFTALFNRGTPKVRHIVLNPQDFDVPEGVNADDAEELKKHAHEMRKKADAALERSPLGREWLRDDKSFVVTRWSPKDPTQTVVVVGFAALIIGAATMLIKHRNKNNKPPKK